MTPNPDLMISPLVLALFPLICIPLVMFLLARIGTWAKLVEKYAYDGSQRPTNWGKFISGRFGSVRYNKCLWVGTTSNGLHIRPAIPFYPEIRIPWTSIKTVQEHVIFGGRTFEFFLSDADLSFHLANGKFIEEARAFLPSNAIKGLPHKTKNNK